MADQIQLSHFYLGDIDPWQEPPRSVIVPNPIGVKSQHSTID